MDSLFNKIIQFLFVYRSISYKNNFNLNILNNTHIFYFYIKTFKIKIY